MASKFVFILLSSFLSLLSAVAQPTLPDIAAVADKGIVMLSWNCQYGGVKSISVLRSSDSVYNYSSIGMVKKLDKGVQAFVDGHPAIGRNYYKLSIVFNTGLKWGSNFCSVNVARPPMESSRLPSNDSLQKFIVKPPADSKATNGKTAPACKMTISFEMDTLQVDAKEWLDANPQKGGQRQKIEISFDEPDGNPALIKSRYLSTDSVTGHVFISLPDDVKQHHYSIKFYNGQNAAIIEVPRINAPKIVMDKRNFQRKGSYKFVLRRDVTELESGYINIW